MAFWVGTLLGPETTHVGVGSLDQSFSALLGPNRGSLEVFFVGVVGGLVLVELAGWCLRIA